MRTLVIPDIHDKTGHADLALKNISFDKAVFLGDFFDSSNGGFVYSGMTAQWLSEKMKDNRFTFLWGNHDIHYAFGFKYLRSSGFSEWSNEQIKEFITLRHWEKFQFYTEVDGWFLSHAGLDISYFLEMGGDLHRLHEEAERAYSAILDQKHHWFFNVGFARGGKGIGGLTWCDFNTELVNPPSLNQICGHTKGKEYQMKDKAICLDANQRYFGLIEDGKLEILSLTLDGNFVKVLTIDKDNTQNK